MGDMPNNAISHLVIIRLQRSMDKLKAVMHDAVSVDGGVKISEAKFHNVCDTYLELGKLQLDLFPTN